MNRLRYHLDQAKVKFDKLPTPQKFIIGYIFASFGFLIGLLMG